MSQQGLRQASIRAVTGRAETHNGDWMALFDLASIPQGPIDGRLLAWINLQMTRSFVNLAEAQQAFATSQGAYNWSSMGTFNAGGVTPPPYTRNWNPTVNLTHWTATRAAVLAGTRRGRLISVGESTNTGYGAGDAASATVNAWARSWPNRLAAKLTARGVPTTTTNFFNGGGGGLTFALMPGYDARRTYGAGWQMLTPTAPVGFFGGAYLNSQTATGNLNFSPGTSFDTIIVHDFTIATLTGTLTVAIDGGANLSPTLPQSPALSYRMTTFAVAAGVHVVNLRGLNNNQTFMGGVQVYNSAVRAVDVIMGGGPGTTVAQTADTSTPRSDRSVLAALAPDITFIKTAVNDGLALTSIAAFKASYQQIIDTALLTGDCVLLTSNWWSGSTQQVQADLRQAAIDLADLNGLLLIDISAYYGANWAAANAAGKMFDVYHPNAASYDAEAAIIDVVLAAA